MIEAGASAMGRRIDPTTPVTVHPPLVQLDISSPPVDSILTPVTLIDLPPTARTAPSAIALCPFYVMSGAATVADLWQEWKYGINGGPSLEYLERTFKTEWRVGSGKSGRMFNRRLHIIERVPMAMGKGEVELVAITRVEGERSGRSMNKFGDAVEKAKKQ